MQDRFAERSGGDLILLAEREADGREQAQLVLPNEFEKNIGHGIRLKSITLERTRDTLIERIPDAPEWLWSLRKQYAPGSKAQSWPSNIIDFDIKQVESEFPPHFHDWSPSQ